MEKGFKVLLSCLLVGGTIAVLAPVVFSEYGSEAPAAPEAVEAPVAVVEEAVVEAPSAEELTGEVVSVDTAAATIVVKTTNEETKASEETILSTNDIVKAEKDGAIVPVMDLKAGDKVTLWHATVVQVEMPTDPTGMEK